MPIKQKIIDFYQLKRTENMVNSRLYKIRQLGKEEIEFKNKVTKAIYQEIHSKRKKRKPYSESEY